MDFENLINALIPYGLPSLIIGTFVGAAYFFAEIILRKKDKTIDAYLPLITGFSVYFIYALAFLPIKEVLSEEGISSGFLCGSLSAGVFVFIKNLKNKNADGLSAIISLLSCYTDEKRAKTAAKKIAEILQGGNFSDDITEKILALIVGEGINSAIAKTLAENVVKIFADKLKDKDKR